MDPPPPDRYIMPRAAELGMASGMFVPLPPGSRPPTGSAAARFVPVACVNSQDARAVADFRRRLHHTDTVHKPVGDGDDGDDDT